jgi:hypothetical protein
MKAEQTVRETRVGGQAEPVESFAALAAAVHPAWHQAIIRLANASERVAFRLEAFMGTPINGGMARHARELVKDLIDFLDQLDADPDLEPTCGVAYGQPPGADECEPPEDDEPSLGSLDRAVDQARAWRWDRFSIDREQDDCDDEPSLGASEHHPTMPWPGQPDSPLRRDSSGSQQFWALGGTDDREDDDPDEAKQQQAEMSPCG